MRKPDCGHRGAASYLNLEPLKRQPGRPVPGTPAVTVQILLTLAVIFGASQLFVRQLECAGPASVCLRWLSRCCSHR
jgi:cation:H+ antiporter